MARIVRFHQYGDPSVLKIEDLDVPPPAADEVQIEVKSIGLNRAEVMFRTHAYLQEAQFPSRLGYEAAGIVTTVGTSVTGFKKGDVVSLIPPTDIARWGTYGELANVPARLAAASWMQYVTAWGALIEQAKLTAGDFVIVTAASRDCRLPDCKSCGTGNGVHQRRWCTCCIRSGWRSVLHPAHREHGAGRHPAGIWSTKHGADALSAVHRTRQKLDLEGLSEWRDHEQRTGSRACKSFHHQGALFRAAEASHRAHVPS